MKNGAWTRMDLDRCHALRAFENQRLFNEMNGILNNNLITSRDFVLLLNEFTNNKAEEAKIMKEVENRMKKIMEKRMKDPKYARLKDKMIIPKSRGYGGVPYPIKELDEIKTDSEIEEMQRVFHLRCKYLDEKFKLEPPEEHPEEWEKMEFKREQLKRKEERRRKKKMKKKKMMMKLKDSDKEEWKKKEEFKREHPEEWKRQERTRRSLKMLKKNLRKLKKKWDSDNKE